MDIAALMLAGVLSLFYRSFMAVLAPFVTADLGVSPSQLSTAVGAWFLFFAVAQVPTGLLLDRVGPRRLVGASVVFGAGGGALLLATAQGALAVQAALALLGAGCAPIMMSGMYLLARRHDPARFATLIAVFMGVAGLGNILSAAPLSWAATLFGWREVMLALTALTAALGALAWAVIRDPPLLEAPARDEPLHRRLGLDGLWELVRHRPLWPIIPIAFTAYAASGGLRGLWAGPYLADIHGLSPTQIGNATLAFALAMTIGNASIAPLDRVLGTRKWLMAGANAIGLACICALAFANPGPWTAAALLVGTGYFCATYALLIAHFRGFVPERLTGRGVTLVNVFGFTGVALGQFATGALADPWLAAGEPATAYDRVFLWYALTLAAALVVYVAFAKDARPGQSAEQAAEHPGPRAK
ncbi:MAG: MFS transporter [Pseudomonadota bacterium]